MLDIKRIREDYDNVKAAVEKRCKGDFGLSEVPGLDSQRREILLKVEQMKNRQFSIWILPTGRKPGNPCSRSLAGLGLQQDAFTACSKRSKPALSTHFGQARFRRSKPSPPSPKI